MPRYLSLFKYTPEGSKGFMKEKAAAREAALKLTIEHGLLAVCRHEDLHGFVVVADGALVEENAQRA